MIESIVGLPGQGKSYLLAYRARREQRRRQVFTNFYSPGSKKLSVDVIKKAIFPQGALLLIDEGGSLFPARGWSDFPMEIFELFSQHRKMKLDMVIATQDSMFIDTNIRRLTQWWWQARNFRLWFLYDLYLKFEDIGFVERRQGQSVVPRLSSVFKSFDSWELQLQNKRVEMDFAIWEERKKIGKKVLTSDVK